MLQRKHLRRLFLFGGLSLILAALAVWVFRTPSLPPAQAALVGAWVTPPQPDGSSTVLVLHPDRSCRLRWLDGAGNEDSAQPSQEGRWRVEGETLHVDTRRSHGAQLTSDGLVVHRSGHVWAFAIQEDTLVHGPKSTSPVTLRRQEQ